MLRSTLAIVLVTLLSLALARPDAIGTLYSRTTSGSLEMTCTASVVEGSTFDLPDRQVVLTAAHCVTARLTTDDGSGETRSNTDFLVSFNEQDFYTVRLLRVGRSERGYDLALLTFHGRAPAVVPLAVGSWADVQVGDRISNYANPLGIGLQQFSGYISMLDLQRPVEGRSILWRGNAVAIVPGAGGSSGSLVLNEVGEVIGVLVGVIQAQMGTPFVVIVPEGKFYDFLNNDVFGFNVTY